MDKSKFTSYLKIDVNSGCWNWCGYIHPRGYGRLMVNKQCVQAHRYSYLIHKGIIKNDLFVLHKCDNRKCVNPDHLFLGTAKDNTNDMIKKGRCKSGLMNKLKTHCYKGHQLSGDNLYRKYNKRMCKTCRKSNLLLSRMKKRGQQ